MAKKKPIALENGGWKEISKTADTVDINLDADTQLAGVPLLEAIPENIDGGSASSTYLSTQIIDGGTASG